MTKKRVNPLHARRKRVPHPKAIFDGQLGHFRFVTTETVAAANLAAQFLTIDVAASGSAAGAAGASIANNYSEYVYHKLTLEWIPSVGPGVAAAGGRGYIAYYDNAEQMVVVAGGTAAAGIAANKIARNGKTFNVWERFVYNVPLTRRKKIFDVNNTNNFTVDVVDRSTQGLVNIGFESIGATDALGRWSIVSEIELRGFNNVAT
jgi:hypothetical protein